MLRTRFTIAVAGAVAAVTLCVAAVAFLAIRADLYNQVQQELSNRAAAVVHQAGHMHGHIPPGWVPSHSTQFGAASPYTQIVTAQGQIWAPPGGHNLLTPDAGAIQVAAGTRGEYYTDATLDGVRAMVLTAPVDHGLAVQLAEPLDTVDAELARIGETLALLSVLGVGLAAVVGYGVARAGLAPVARLAAVAEEVGTTGDPGKEVEVGRPDELGRLAATFNNMLTALRRSQAAQRKLVSDASHELRTPLTSLRVNVDLLAEDPDMPADERQEVLNRAAEQVAELGELVAGVTQIARGESPAQAHEDLKLNEVTASALEAARRDWPQTTFRAQLQPCVVRGSGDRLRIAIRNLLDNAAKFGPPGGRVEVSLADGELCVRDHGPGIAPADLPHVFDRFYRATQARSVPGSGLGLAIVRQVTHAHSGTIIAEAPPDGGTRFRLRLPAGDPSS
jgi:two-component system, OmpR family, sensor histidine kinase MprB